MSKTTNFKTCPSCGTEWPDLAAFVADEDLTYAGYQVSFVDSELGFFLFNHSCGTTFTVGAAEIQAVRGGAPVRRERLFGTDRCPGYCLNKLSLEPCPAECECQFVREIIAVLGRKK